MVVEDVPPRPADLLFRALADPTRRDIVTRTLRCEHSVSDLARSYPMSFAAVQKHVAVLERADLVRKRRHGREQLVRGNVDAIRRTHLLLEEFEASWRGRLDRFAHVLADDLDRRPEPTDHPEPTDDPERRSAP